MKYFLSDIFDEYCKTTEINDFSNTPSFNDNMAQNASLLLVNKNLKKYLSTKDTSSLFNLILSDKRIPISNRHIMLAKLDVIDIESSNNNDFKAADTPHKISFDNLLVGTVFLWCDMLHVYIGPYLAAEVKSDLSEALCVYSFNESCRDRDPLTEIIRIGECNPIKIKNIKECF